MISGVSSMLESVYCMLKFMWLSSHTRYGHSLWYLLIHTYPFSSPAINVIGFIKLVCEVCALISCLSSLPCTPEMPSGVSLWLDPWRQMGACDWSISSYNDVQKQHHILNVSVGDHIGTIFFSAISALIIT